MRDEPSVDAGSIAIAVLMRAGYRSHGPDLLIGGLRLEFSEVLTGPGESEAVVVVQKIADSEGGDLVRKVRSLLMALGSSGSRRVATLIVACGSETSTAKKVGRLMRTICVTTDMDESAIARTLSPLVPLHLPVPTESSRRGLEELRERVSSTRSRDIWERLMEASAGGASAVETEFLRQVERAVGEASDD